MAQINSWQTIHKGDFKDYTLILASVAIGNVGQLACDLVVSSLQMKKISSVHSPALIPVAGYDPYNTKSSELAGSCALYQSEPKKILILLLRAPLVYKYAEQFLTEVVQKFKAENIKDIIILTSGFAYEKKHIMTSPFRYMANEWCSYVSKIKSLEWVEHDSSQKEFKVHGGGFSSLLYKIVQKEAIPCLLIYKFTSEGNNIPDAYEMTQYLNAVVNLFDETDFYSKLVHPPSWKLLFGRPPPINIY